MRGCTAGSRAARGRTDREILPGRRVFESSLPRATDHFEPPSSEHGEPPDLQAPGERSRNPRTVESSWRVASGQSIALLIGSLIKRAIPGKYPCRSCLGITQHNVLRNKVLGLRTQVVSWYPRPKTRDPMPLCRTVAVEKQRRIRKMRRLGKVFRRMGLF